MPELELRGCTTRPLAAYLKALGILRLVCEQKDQTTRGFWQKGCFVLSGPLDREELCRFFLEEYRPTPLVSPWNGGSGFYPKDNKEGIDAIAASPDERLAKYREVIAQVRSWPELTRMQDAKEEEKREKGKQEEGKKGKSSKNKVKMSLLQRARAELPEECLPWLDAACVLGEDESFYAPLLGTGGNDGRLEYTNTFMQRVERLFVSKKTTAEQRELWLESSLFDRPVNTLPKGAIGQFDPGNAGGINQGMGTECGTVRINPWDFLLMLEGTVLFASALVRRTPDDTGRIAAPFTASAVSAGFASSSLADESRGEIWMPLWARPVGLTELRRLLGEGRMTVEGRQAKSGLGFARAVSSLGVERGISGFERYSFLKRRGKSYVALPSGRLAVTCQSRVDLLAPVIRFLDLRPLKKEAPASFVLARRRLNEAVFACTQNADSQHFLKVSRALAALDSLPGLLKLLKHPCSALSPGWIDACGDGPEIRLAAALASLSRSGKLGALRAHLAPVDPARPSAWDESSAQYVRFRGTVLEYLGKILGRRLLLAETLGENPWRSAIRLDPADLLPLLEARLDLALLSDLTRTFSLIAFSRKDKVPFWPKPLQEGPLPYALSLCKLFYTDWFAAPRTELDTSKLEPERRFLNLIAADRGQEACALLVQRLRIAGGQSLLYLPASCTILAQGLPQPALTLTALLTPLRLSTLLKTHLNLKS